MPDSNNPDECSKKEGKHPLEYFIAVFLVLTFIATAIAAYYTCQQWLTAYDTEKRSLRAYVGVSRPRLQCPDCGNSSYKEPGFADGMIATANLLEFVIKVSGVTPAYNVHLRHVDWEPIPINILYPFGSPYVKHADVAQVAESRPTILPSESLPFQVAIRVRDFEDPKIGKYRLRLYGDVDYTDVFDRDWTAEFCFIYQGISGVDEFTTCPEHNGDHPRVMPKPSP